MIAIHRQKFAVPHLEFLLAEGILVGPRTVEARLAEGGSRRFVADRLFLNLGSRATIPGVPGPPRLAAHPCGSTRARSVAFAPDRARRRICRGRVRAGLQAVRQPGDDSGIRQAATWPRRPGCRHGGNLRILEEDGVDVVLSADTQAVEGRFGDAVRLHVQTRTPVLEPLRAPIFSWRPAAARTLARSGSNRPALTSTHAASSRSTIVYKQPQPECGPWAIAPVALNSLTSHSTTSGLYVTISRALPRSTRDRLIPYCAFIDSVLARVGLDETTTLRQQGIAIRVAKLPMTSVHCVPARRRDTRIHEDPAGCG